MIRHTITCLATMITLGTTACVEEPQARDIGFAPRSLDGTEIDGAFHYSREGHFVFDEDARQAFDYFLTADGELTPTQLQDWVDVVIVAEVSPAERTAVIDSWYAYVAYRKEAAAAATSESAMSQPQQAKAALLSALDAGFAGSPFAAAERERIERAFALRGVYDRLGDDHVARDAELARLDADATARFADSRAGRLLAARRSVETARSEATTTAQLHSLRAQQFDADNPGAADRLAALDAKRADWDARVEAYQLARAAARAQWVGAPSQLDEALVALEQMSFTPAERRRVRALEQL